MPVGVHAGGIMRSPLTGDAQPSKKYTPAKEQSCIRWTDAIGEWWRAQESSNERHVETQHASPTVTKESDGETIVVSTSETVIKRKKSTAKWDAETKLIATLTLHHKYEDGGCLNFDQIGIRDLARQAEVGPSSANRFIKKHFANHAGYRVACRAKHRLITILKKLNGDTPPDGQIQLGEDY